MLSVAATLLQIVLSMAAKDESAYALGSDLSFSTGTVADQLEWVDAKPFLRGTGFPPNKKSAFYDRLPAAAVNTTRAAVWGLSRDTAGMYLSFASNTTDLIVNVTYVYGSFEMWHFPSTGVAGMDLYAFDENTSAWRWTSTTHSQGPRRTASNRLTTTRVCSSVDVNTCKLTRYRLHLPLYNGVLNLSLGFNAKGAGCTNNHCVLVADTDPRTLAVDSKPPVVWYGTSIAQGGVASRPGMAFTNSIARNIDRPVLNFGFSGNGIMEIGVAQWLVQIEAAAFVIDCNWNMNGATIAKAIVPLVKYIRQTRPNTPIILAEGTEAGASWISLPTHQSQAAKRASLRAGYESLVAAGDTHLHYVNGTSLFRFNESIAVDPNGIINPTVGGTHPSDLGMKAVSDFYTAFLPTVLGTDATTIRPPHLMSALSVVPDGKAASVAEDQAHMHALQQSMSPFSAHKENIPDPVGQHSSLVEYTDVQHSSLVVMGRAFDDVAEYYNRLPGSAKGVVRDAVWRLSQMSTGMFVPFVTNSTMILWNYSLVNSPTPMWHMPASGMHGADLFCRSTTDSDTTPAPYRFVGAATRFPAPPSNLAIYLGAHLSIPGSGPQARLHCGIYLPLRNTIATAAIGVQAGAMLEPDPNFGADGVTWGGKKPIVWYGTSIDQGGVASRPGATYTNVLSRLLERMVLNFGFAGNGVMEETVAQYLTTLDPAMFVIDCLPNMQAGTITSRTVPLVQFLRKEHPTTPILLTAGTTYGAHWINPASNEDKRRALKAQFDKLVAAGDKHVHLMLDEMDELFARDPLVNPTVGGTHPSDLGHREIATFWASYLPQFLD